MFNTKDTYPNQSLDNDLCQAVRVFPISTGLCISALGQPQWLMEIDVIAVIPEGWQPGAQ
jgi:hypothetical protein